jgi:hypothetical protein
VATTTKTKPRSRKQRFETTAVNLLTVNVKHRLGWPGTIKAILDDAHPIVLAAAVDVARAKRDRCVKGTQKHAEWSVAYHALYYGSVSRPIRSFAKKGGA